MIKRIFLYMALIMSLVACSDDIFNAPTETMPTDGKLTISFNVPEMTEPQTRAEEDMISKVKILIFKDGVLEQIPDDIDNPGIGERVMITIDEALRRSDLYFLFVANSDVSSFAKKTSLTDVRKKLADDVWDKESGILVMSGAATLQSLLALEPVDMFRNAAKMTVKDKNDGKAYPFAVYGIAAQSPIMAGASNADNSFQATGAPATVNLNSLKKELNADIKYLHPTTNTGTAENKSFVIVKVPYGTGEAKKEYFYRLNLHDKDGNVLDILPNYYYDIQILATPRTIGFSTQEEAAKNPVSAEEDWYVIHDHAPVIFNMVSDGQRELGVSHILRNPNTAENTTSEIFIKVYSKKNSSEEDKSNINITFEDSWLTIESIGEVTDGDAGIYGIEVGDDTKGKVYKVTVRFNKTSNTGVLTSNCTVSWQGLVREIPVEWDRTFDPTQLFESVKLTIKGGEEDVEIDDYFTFIHGVYDDNGKEITAPSVWGASADANNGEARDLGLHFPLQYGEVGSEYTYEYEIQLGDLGEGKEYTWSYEINGDLAIAGKVQLEVSNGYTLTGVGPKFKLTRSGAGWEYGVGELEIKVGDASYTIDLYHTGFLHKDYLEQKEKGIGLAPNYVPAAGREYTYYEVVSMGDTHWLDRNLGAHSSDMFVKASTGKTYSGDPEAAGGYYRVASYIKYEAPYKEEAICPPGYSYPTQLNYNSMRTSPDFFTGQDGSYYTAAYSADIYDSGSKRKVVYFPKSLYLDEKNNLAGESRAGYYWSATTASGSEKEEIGAWLLCFNLSGDATSFVNGEVYCSEIATSTNSTRTGEINGYAMPVRCVSKSDVQTTPEATSFFVKGATHVFLYTENEDGTNRSPVTSWPGITISSYNTVFTNFNLLYESAINTPDRLYVIFNYKDEKGMIHSLSKNVNGSLSEAFYSNSISPSELKGWSVIGDDAPDWIQYGEATLKTNINSVENDSKYYWMCDFFSNEAKAGLSLTERNRMFIKNNSNYNPIYVYAYKDGDNSGLGTWPGTKSTYSVNIFGTEYDVVEYDAKNGSYNLIFNNGSSGGTNQYNGPYVSLGRDCFIDANESDAEFKKIGKSKR